MKLYELSQNFKNLQQVLENAGEDENLKELVINSMKELECDLSTKVENIVRLIKNLQAEVEALKAEEKRLARERKIRENKIENLQGYLFDTINGLEKREIKGGIFTVSIKKNPPKTIVEDLNVIPKQFIINTPSIDKKMLKEALKNGEIIEGAKLVQEESLKIR